MDRSLRACERRLRTAQLLVVVFSRSRGSYGGRRDMRGGSDLAAQAGDHAEPRVALGDLCRGGVLQRLEPIFERHQPRTANMFGTRPCLRSAQRAALRTLALRSTRQASICEPG